MINTTIVGYGEVTSPNIKTYIDRLEQHLSTYYPAISWRIYDVRLKKCTLGDLKQHLKDKVLSYHPNIIFIRLSSQDVDIERNDFVGKEQLEIYLSELLDEVIAHNNRTGLNNCIPVPVVITPPLIFEKPNKKGRTNNRLKQYIYALKGITLEKGGVVINLYEEISKRVNKEKYILEEGYGLTQEGENLLYDLIFIELTKLIDYQGVLKNR